MIFRSIVILCALSACAAGKTATEKPVPAAVAKTPTATAQSVTSAPNPEADLKRANSLIKLGQPKSALKVLTKWETKTDAPAEILYTLGRLRAASDQLVAAANLYERAIKSKPKRSWRIELAAIYDFAGKPSRSIELYRTLLQEKEDAALRRELGLTLLMAQESAAAVTELSASLKAQPNLETRAELSLALCKSGEYQRADATLRTGVNSDASGLYAPAAIGEILRCLGEPNAALNLVKALKPRLEPALYQRLVEALSKQAHSGQGS